MSGQRNIFITLGLVLSVSFIASALSAILVLDYYSRLQFRQLNAICGEVLEQEPEAEKIIFSVLKKYAGGNVDETKEKDILFSLGYRVSDFSVSDHRQNVLFVLTGFFAGIFLFIVTFLYRNKMEAGRIHTLIDYLEQVNTGKAVVLRISGEDDFSKLLPCRLRRHK